MAPIPVSPMLPTLLAALPLAGPMPMLRKAPLWNEVPLGILAPLKQSLALIP